mgnify:CR=1 FL=1
MKALTDVLSKNLQWICVVLFTLLVIIVVWQVVARQIFNNPQAWTEEASRMTFVWLGLFAAALVFAERGHIAVDFVVRKFSPAGQKVVGIIVQPLIIFFAASLMVYGGIRAGSGAGNQRLAALDFLTLGQMYLVLPISGVLIILFALANIVEIARGEIDAFPQTGEEQLVEGMAAEGALPVDDELVSTAAVNQDVPSGGSHAAKPTDSSKEA